MDELEYEQQSERVAEYRKLNREIFRLENEKSTIGLGVLSARCSYCSEINFRERHEGFQDNLQKTLIQFYDDEIERLMELMEEI